MLLLNTYQELHYDLALNSEISRPPLSDAVPVGTEPSQHPFDSQHLFSLLNTLHRKISDLDFTGILLGSTGIFAGKHPLQPCWYCALQVDTIG